MVLAQQHFGSLHVSDGFQCSQESYSCEFHLTLQSQLSDLGTHPLTLPLGGASPMLEESDQFRWTPKNRAWCCELPVPHDCILAGKPVPLKKKSSSIPFEQGHVGLGDIFCSDLRVSLPLTHSCPFQVQGSRVNIDSESKNWKPWFTFTSKNKSSNTKPRSHVTEVNGD